MSMPDQFRKETPEMNQSKQIGRYGSHMTEQMITLNELCELAHITPSGFRNLRQQGRVPVGYKMGRRMFFKQEDAQKWLTTVRMVRVDPPRAT